MSLSRLFVVAPHPDDDTIGCGGLMAAVAAAGEVAVAYVTDGSLSHPGSRRYPPEAVAALREGEARSALAALGVAREPVFLRIPDGSPPQLSRAQQGAAIARLAAEIDRFAPQLVLGPWLRDPHPDHVATARLALAAARRASSRPAFGCYEVWLRIRGAVADYPREAEARTVEIALGERERARKREALFAHRSQTGLIDDDAEGFRIDEDLLERWLGPSERFYFLRPNGYEPQHAHRIGSASRLPRPATDRA